MANGRRPIPPMRAYTAAVLGVFALFVISVGAGMASWSIVVLGLALIILAVSLVVVSAMRGGARAYVAGTAHVVSASKPPASSIYGRCELHLLIDAPGMATSAVTIRDPRVPVAKWPDAGTTLPIMVAADDPRRVRIQWDGVPTHAETATEAEVAAEDAYAGGYAADAYAGGYAEDEYAGDYAEDEYATGYAEDYSDEYPEYVPTRDPLDLRPEATPADREPPPPAGDRPPVDRGEPSAADLTDDRADLREGDPPAASAPTSAAPATASAPTSAAPATAASTSAASATAASPPTARTPPAPRRPEASPETPEEEVYLVDGEPVFSPKVPPAPEGSDLADSAPGSADPVPSGEDRQSDSPPRPRPRPHSTASGEQAAAGAPRAAATTGTAVASPDQEPGEGAEAQGTPSVTAIEFDLGGLIPAYPNARPGRAGPIHGVGITVHVRDLAESAAFYRDVLGFYEIDGGDGTVVLASGDTRLVLRAVRDIPPVDPSKVDINLEVADVQAVYEELKAKGVRFTNGPRPTSQGERLEPWAARFRDPDGHGIAITQWRSRDD